MFAKNADQKKISNNQAGFKCRATKEQDNQTHILHC